MGKHLAPSPKHELNFISKKPTRMADPASGPTPHVARGEAYSAPPELSVSSDEFSLESILAEVKSGTGTTPETRPAEASGTEEAQSEAMYPAANPAKNRGRNEAASSDAHEKTGDVQTESTPSLQDVLSPEKADSADETAPASGPLSETHVIAEKNRPEEEKLPEEKQEKEVKLSAEDTGVSAEEQNTAEENISDKEKAPVPKKRAVRRGKAAKKLSLRERAGALRRGAAAKTNSVPVRMPHPLLFLAASLMLLIVIPFLRLDGWMVMAAYAVPALLALADPAADALVRIKAGDRLCPSVLSCLAAGILFVLGDYTEAVLLPIFTTAARLLEEHLVKNNEDARKDALDILPKYAVRVSEDGLQRVDPAEVNTGDILLVSAGERIPLDGIIIEGITTVDTAAVSGQRSPWAVNTGYRVYSGCRNLTSDIKIRVTRPYKQSTVKKLVDLAESAADFPSEQEQAAARFNRFFVPALVILAVLALFIPIFRHNWAFWLRRAAVLLIAARTCTESFSLPLLYRRSLLLAGKDGVFAKGGDCLEALARAETMIFDKTGTITEGRYAVTDVYPVKMSERQLLSIAATAESFSRHPIAAAIRETAGRVDERILKRIRIKDIPGRGVSALIDGRQLFVGNAALLEENGIHYNIPARPGTAIHVSVDKRYCGYIIVADKVRRRAFDALENLRVNGIQKLVLLSGDVMSVARPVASRLNFDMLRAELKPEEKAKAVNYLMKNKGARSSIALVEEGSNISRMMSDTDVGIAMGALGSEMALACADLLIMDRDIFKLPHMVALSRHVYRLGAENLYGGAAVQVLVALFGMLGVFTPLAAEIIGFVLSLLLLANTFRMKK